MQDDEREPTTAELTEIEEEWEPTEEELLQEMDDIYNDYIDPEFLEEGLDDAA